MINRKEIIVVLLITLILAFALSLRKLTEIEFFLYTFISIFLVIAVNVGAKKISSYYLDSEVEVGLWEIKRAGIMHFLDIIPFHTTHPSAKLKKPLPIGVFLPVITTLISVGYFVWMASLTFEVKPKVYRAAKRFGFYSFSEMTEYHIGLIAAAGIITNLLFGIIGYLIGFSDFARFNIYYAFFNLLPLSELDGNKIFFGSIILWSFLASLVLIGLGYVFLVI